jgi:UDP-N-acetylmuramate dehydrogenase
VIALARRIRDGVRDVFGITLEPEPLLLGCRL